MARMSPPKRELEALATQQAGVVSRKQALRLGVTPKAIECAIAAKRWQRVYPGVYAFFTGPLPELSRMWAGLLWAGEDAVLGSASALRQFGVTSVADPGRIHVVVDHSSKTRNIDGVSVTRRRDLARFVHPVKRPPSVRLEDAALHEAAAKPTVKDGLAVIADVCQQRVTTEARLRQMLIDMPRLPGKAIWTAVLDDVASGAHSLLEVSYLRNVERAHGLPKPNRQRAGTSLARRVWRDGEYPDLGVALELDGRLGHEWASDRRLDRKRDLVVAGSGGVALRHGYADVLDEACETAALVVRVLWSRGWQGQPTACGPECTLWDVLHLLDSA
jgi:hypothetical protein